MIDTRLRILLSLFGWIFEMGTHFSKHTHSRLQCVAFNNTSLVVITSIVFFYDLVGLNSNHFT